MRVVYRFFRPPFAFFFAGRAFGQPVTVIGVVWWIRRRSGRANSVGICSVAGSVFLTLRVTVFLRPWTADRDLLLDGDGVRGRAEVPEGGQRAVGALGEREFEARDRLVGDGLEGAAGDPGFADERVAVRTIVKP